MANAARKARKRAGIKFEKAPKVGTPAPFRSYVRNSVPGAPGTKYEGTYRRRSPEKVLRFLEAFSE